MSDTSDDGGDDQPICGSTDTADGSPCEFPVNDPDDRCHMHSGDGPPDGHGSGTNPQPVAGDGEPPENNKNAMKHGLYAAERDPSGLFQWFRENDPAAAEMIRRHFWTYMDQADFPAYAGDDYDRHNPPVVDAVDVDALEAADGRADGIDTEQDATHMPGAPRQQMAPDAPPVDVQSLTGLADQVFQVAVHQIVIKRVTLDQASDGLTTMETRATESGVTYEVEVEQPGNLPKERMRKTDLQTLKSLGVITDGSDAGSGDSVSWEDAVRRVAERNDSAIDPPDEQLPTPDQGGQ